MTDPYDGPAEVHLDVAHGSHSHGSHPHGGHSHGAAAARAGERHRRPLTIAFCLIVAFLVVQVVAGIATGSLALLSDAGHMATDAIGLGMALAAIHLASRTKTRRHRTFGLYRLEILAALANSILLFGVAGYVLVEAAMRLGDPEEVPSLTVLAVATLGLVVNLVSFRLLREGAAESLNVEGAYVEVLSDLLGSIGVMVAAGLMWLTGWEWVDPVVGAAIGVFILPRAFRLGRDASRILLQEAPAGVDLEAIAGDLERIEGVVGVHDLHVWTLTSEMDVLTAHVMTTDGADAHGVLDRARALLAADHGIAHATLQVEPETHTGCEELTW